MKNNTFKKKGIQALLSIVVIFLVWVALFASSTTKASVLGFFGYFLGQAIILSCAAAIVFFAHNYYVKGKKDYSRNREP